MAMLEGERTKLVETVTREEGGVGFHCSGITARCMEEFRRLAEKSIEYKSNVEEILSGTTKTNPMSTSDIADKIELGYPYVQYGKPEQDFYRRNFAYYAAMDLAADDIVGIVHEDDEGFSFYLKSTDEQIK